MAQWLIPWRERGRSGPVHDSFLWCADRLYVMDNHRLALWCWWQLLAESPHGWSFVHVDRHYDAAWQKRRPWTAFFVPAHKTDLQAFRDALWRDRDEPMNLYRWDTIVSGLLTMDGECVHQWTFATAGEGDRPPLPQAQHLSPWSLPAHLRSLAEPDEQSYPAVVDIDIDYFTHAEEDGTFGRVFSDPYLRELGASVGAGLANGRFGVVTVALSPTTTGSWQLAEEICCVLLEQHPDLSHLRAGAP